MLLIINTKIKEGLYCMVEIKTRLDTDDHYDGGNTKEYIVIHDTGNATDSDEGNANYFCTGSRGASAHYFVDDDSITQVVKDDDCSWHCGDGHNAYGIGNRNSIGVEQCRVNGVVTQTTENNTLDLVVMLMKKYNVPIEKVVRHFDASRKNCPASFNLDGKWTKWYDFKNRLAVKLAPAAPQLYRVRLSADDVKSQIEADYDIDNARACADAHKGYSVFDSNGNKVYPVTVSTPVPTPAPKPVASAPQTSVVYNVRFLQHALNVVYGAGLKEDNAAGRLTLGACPVIAIGSRGDVVRFIQSKVGAGIDGAFGTQTYKAVLRFQAAHGLKADGIVGRNTWTKLLGL